MQQVHPADAAVTVAQTAIGIVVPVMDSLSCPHPSRPMASVTNRVLHQFPDVGSPANPTPDLIIDN
jgi:hypothetical protein